MMSSSAVFVVSGEGAGQSGGHVRSLPAEGGHSVTFCRYVCVWVSECAVYLYLYRSVW